jgi:uncharacterized membrane protein
MKKLSKLGLLFAALVAVCIVCACAATALAQESAAPLPLPEKVTPTYYSGAVTKITPQENAVDPSIPGDTVAVELKLQNGKTVTAPWSNNPEVSRSFIVKEGDKVVAMCTTVNNQESCDIMERQRTSGLVWLLAVFLAVIWFVTRKQGLRAAGTMILGLGVILFVIIPLILKGWSPLLVTVVGGIAILVPTIYLSHGFNTKSHIALGSILIAVLGIGILSLIFSNVLHLTGFTGEETNYLSQNINLRAVLLSAILLGALGVIDDIAMTQVSIVNELYHSNRNLSSLALFTRAMSVGQDHIASVINTLFLAYASVSLPLLILIAHNELPFFVALQQEPIATEIMRTLVGTIGLVLVVPLTTYIASQAISRYPERFPAEQHHHFH